ncbi:MAG: cupin [Pseudomonadales bacterium]|nr:cupin [Pseudomonadales bacterium]
MLNMDFSQRVVVSTDALEWQQSSKEGVWRKPLAREEAERGHATSIVKYEPGASFSEHGHPLGEEILVLEGTFSDETGDYSAGTYFRNPEGFRHTPFSEAGCIILVKLHQFQEQDTSHVQVELDKAEWEHTENGLQILLLHEFNNEKVALIRWPAGLQIPLHSHDGGEEVFVMQGKFSDEHGKYPVGTWVRLPNGSEHSPRADEDTLIWIKAGHLSA